MKTLSLKQPWAELILQNKKVIETRKWNTSFRGEFLIHASKNVDKESMARFGFSSLPTGCIIGKAFLVEVKPYPSKSSFDADQSLHYVPQFDKPVWKQRYGFILKDICRLKEKSCKGQLNFFDVDYEKL